MKKILKNIPENIRSWKITVVRKTVLPMAVATLTFAVTMTGCVKDELFNTPHPDKGVVTVSADFPQDFIVEIDGKPIEGTVSAPLAPGEHTVLAYNVANGFTVTDGIARVNTIDITRSVSTLIAPLPGDLYSGRKTINVVEDDTLSLELDVAKRTRDLRFELTVTEGDPERLVSAKGTLAGIAGAFDLNNETMAGGATATATDFTRNGNLVTADLRLLGTMGDTQKLTLVLTFIDGNMQTVESDLTEVLKDFNQSTDEPFKVAGSLSLPVKAGVGGCTITGWQAVTGSDIDAH